MTTATILQAAFLGWDYAIQSERPGFTLWRVSYATGSKLECLGHFERRRDCRRAWSKAVYRAYLQKKKAEPRPVTT